MLDALDQKARTARDDRRGNLGIDRVLHRFFHRLEVLRIDDDDVLVAVGGKNVLDLQLFGDLALECEAAARVVLMTGHAGDRVIEHDGNDVPLIVDDLRRAGHAGVEERGIADHAEDLFVGLTGRFERLCHAHGDRKAAAHADAGIQSGKRRGEAERVAADVACHNVVLMSADRVEEAAVRAARAQSRRTGDGLDADVDRFRLLAEQTLAEKLRIELIEVADQFLADALDARRFDLLLHERIELLDDVELFDLLRKRADQVHRKRIGETELQERRARGERVLGILIRDRSGDDADLGPVDLLFVELRSVCVRFERLKILFDLRVVLVRVRGGRNVFHVALIRGNFALLALAEANETLRMRDARGDAVHDRHVELLGDLIGLLQEVEAFLRIAGLDHCDLRRARIVPVVLLVLRGVHAGIVRRDDDEAAANAVVRRRKQRVRRHVDADVLHRREGTDARDRRAVRDLDRNLLVRRPLAVQSFLILREVFKDFRAGRARIRRADTNARFERAARDRFVAGKQNRIHDSFRLSDLFPNQSVWLYYI